MRRAVGILVPIVSTILLLVTLAFWGRSYWWVADGLSWGDDNRIVTVNCDRGGLILGRINVSVPSNGAVSINVPHGLQITHQPPAGYRALFGQLSLSSTSLLGFSVAINSEHSTLFVTFRVTAVAIPFWFPTLLFAIAPVRWVVVTRRRRLREFCRQKGLCPACGYDLRASPERCPECGHVNQDRVPTAPA